MESAGPAITLQEIVDAPRTPSQLLDMGQRLFCSLFAGDAEHTYRAALAHADSMALSDGRSRLRIELTVLPTELAARPWELLYDPVRERFLAAEGKISLSRSLVIHEPTRPLSEPSRLRVLGLFPEGSGLRTADERSALESLAARRNLDFLCLDSEVTVEAVFRAVGDQQPHIVHFSGHGSYHGHSGISLDGPKGLPQPLDATSFARVLAYTGRPPAVAVISACEGGLAGTTSLRSIASALLRHGVLGVVAMQTRIQNSRAACFSEEFYRALANSPTGDLEMAVGCGRSLLLGARNHNPAFASPVLYLRGGEFELWPEALESIEEVEPRPAPRDHDTAVGWRVDREAHSGSAVHRVHGGVGNIGSVQNWGGGPQFFGSTIEVAGGFNFNGDQAFRSPEQWRMSAMDHLDCRQYERALSDLKKATRHDKMTHRDHYLTALAKLAGRRPKRLKRDEVFDIERSLLAAREGSELGHYRLFLAVLKYDYYVLNGLKERPPSQESLIAEIDVEGLDQQEVRNLLNHLPTNANNPAHAIAITSLTRNKTADNHEQEEIS